MRIMFVISTNLSGGAERVISVLSNELVNNNDIYIINFDRDSDFYEIDSRVRVIKLGSINKKVLSSNRILKMIALMTEITKQIKTNRPDVVIPFLFNAELPTYIACGMTNTPCITSIRNTPTSYPKYQRLIRKVVFKHIAGVVFQSRTVQEHSDFTSVKKSTVIMNPLGYRIVSTIPTKTRGKLISVGRLNPQKNHGMTIKAISRLIDKYPDIRLHIFGDGPEKSELISLTKKLNLTDNVIFEGVVNNAISDNEDAEMFIMSSNYEGFPNALVEAMACGIPVICTELDSGVTKELLGENENGIVIPVDDDLSLAKGIQYIFQHPEVADKMARSALQKCELIKPSVIADQWTNFIMNCIK